LYQPWMGRLIQLRPMLNRVLWSLLIGAMMVCAQPKFEITSLLGKRLESQVDDKGVVEAARKALAADPSNIGLVVKLSAAQASLWMNVEADATCTKALKEHPDNIDLLTERGHRRVALRRFAEAKADLARAITLGSKNPETFYHLGLAHLFLGEYPEASMAFCDKGLMLAPNEDSKVNSTNWCYATSRRAGLNDKANLAIAWVGATEPAGHSAFYYNLVRFFQKAKTEAEVVPASAGSDMESELRFSTVAFGIANWYLANGDTAKAKAYFERIVQGKVWGTWGYVGSEVELARMRK
jgi:tetratricopeptide (TPR) repeat protein